MHAGQVEITMTTVERALEEQVPEIFGLPVARVASAGTVVVPFRVGEAFVARFPLVPSSEAAARDRLRAEAEHALFLAGRLPVEVPRPIQVGEPFEGYPGYWSLWTWVEGESLDTLLASAASEGSTDGEARSARPDGGCPAPHLELGVVARDLAGMLRTFRLLGAPDAWSDTGRGGRPLSDGDWVRSSIERSAHVVDAAAATDVWERALAAPPHAGRAVRIHGDPLPGNLIVRDGRLAGLIDVSEPVSGDPAADLQPAWVIFDEPARSAFRIAMGLDEAAWERGRGWAFEMAISGLWYYEHTNPAFSAMAARTLARLLAA